MPIIETKPIDFSKTKLSYFSLRRSIQSTGETIRRRDIALGNKVTNVFPGQDIQKAIDKVNKLGGGTVFLKVGTHSLITDLTLYSNIYLQGENAGSSIISFGNNAKQIKIVGSGAYSTGTIAITNGGVTVTGTTTSWLANVSAGQNIMIKGIWYPISAVVSDTELTIAIPYADINVSGVTYVAATTINEVQLINFTITASGTAAVKAQYGSEIFLRDINIQASVSGLDFDDCSQSSFHEIDLVANYSGADFNNCHFTIFDACGVLDSLTGNGVTMTNCSSMALNDFFILNSAGDGLSMTNCEDIKISGNFTENAGQGIEFVSGNDNIDVDSFIFKKNGSDGVKFTATMDNCHIGKGVFKNNGGYGINIAASSCNDNIISSCIFTGNTSGGLNDSGVGTISLGNVGLNALETKEHFRFKNTSGGSLAAGDLVTFKAVAAGDEVTTTTIQGDDLIFAMAVETITNNSYGRFQTLGKTTALKVDGTTDIAIGDFIGSFTSAGIGMKAAAGDMAIAIALEAYTANDSNGVIDALLIKPRKI